MSTTRVMTVEAAARHIADRLARAVRSGSVGRVVASGNFATPTLLGQAVINHTEHARWHMLNPQRGLELHDGVIPETTFVGPGFRGHPQLSYIPARLGLVPSLFRSSLAPDVVLLHTTGVRDGQVSLGLEVNIMCAAIDAARARGALVVAQANQRMPWTFGDSVLNVDQIDVLVDVEQPLPTVEPTAPSADAVAIGEAIGEVIGDGSTLQAGIGEVPDAVVRHVLNRRHLRMWTEMFSDGALQLERAGALDVGAPLVTSFIFGSQELYDWVDGNPRIKMTRTERTNDPAHIAKQPAMTSINTALQVDLLDQANASRINARIYSGFGGQSDFTVGAIHSRGGNAFMALRSWHRKADRSTIVPLLTEPVTSYQHSAVVTENGTAWLAGRDQHEQARNLIELAAHPAVRDELWLSAQGLGLA